MTEIKNYTLNFSSGRSLCELNFAIAKLACAEIERALNLAKVRPNG